MALVRKTIEVQIKQVAEESRSVVAVASTETRDRQNDIVRASGWQLDNFLKNPVIIWGHDYQALPVAKAVRVWVEGGELLFEAQFPTAEEYSFADTVFRLIKGGYLKAFSVGFDPVESKIVEHEGGGRGVEYLQQELWEISLVTVPANPEALVRMGQPQPADDDLREIKARLEIIETSLNQKAAAPAQPEPEPQPQPEPQPPAPEKAIDPQLVTRALAEALPDAVGAALDRMLTERIKYHRGQVD